MPVIVPDESMRDKLAEDLQRGEVFSDVRLVNGFFCISPMPYRSNVKDGKSFVEFPYLILVDRLPKSENQQEFVILFEVVRNPIMNQDHILLTSPLPPDSPILGRLKAEISATESSGPEIVKP